MRKGFFQWQLRPLSEKELEITHFVMGEMAMHSPFMLEEHGIGVEASVFADWRGSLDKVSRNPTPHDIRSHGAYSTSLYIPKEYLQEASAAFGTNRKVLDIFYPMMHTGRCP